MINHIWVWVRVCRPGNVWCDPQSNAFSKASKLAISEETTCPCVTEPLALAILWNKRNEKKRRFTFAESQARSLLFYLFFSLFSIQTLTTRIIWWLALLSLLITQTWAKLKKLILSTFTWIGLKNYPARTIARHAYCCWRSVLGATGWCVQVRKPSEGYRFFNTVWGFYLFSAAFRPPSYFKLLHRESLYSMFRLLSYLALASTAGASWPPEPVVSFVDPGMDPGAVKFTCARLWRWARFALLLLLRVWGSVWEWFFMLASEAV